MRILEKRVSTALGLVLLSDLRRTKVKLDLLTYRDAITNRKLYLSHAIYQYVKANNKYMKDYEKNKQSSYIKYWDVNKLSGRATSQK